MSVHEVTQKRGFFTGGQNAKATGHGTRHGGRKRYHLLTWQPLEAEEQSKQFTALYGEI